MIHELESRDFAKVFHLLRGERINLEIEAVAKAYNPGWIFVDSLASPKTAMVWPKGIEGFYFIGDAQNPVFAASIGDYIDQFIVPRAKKLGLEYFEFSGTGEEWDEQLITIFGDRDIATSTQYVYRCSDFPRVSGANGESAGYALAKITKALLQNPAYDLTLVENNIDAWWSSAETFFRSGIGYCIIHGRTAVCVCLTSFMTGQLMEPYVVTQKGHRNRGLALRTASAFVTDAINYNYGLYWDCMEANYSSRAVAEKLGFTKAFEYRLYEFRL